MKLMKIKPLICMEAFQGLVPNFIFGISHPFSQRGCRSYNLKNPQTWVRSYVDVRGKCSDGKRRGVWSAAQLGSLPGDLELLLFTEHQSASTNRA